MTINEAKKILLAAPLNPTERLALQLLLTKIDYHDLPNEIWRDVVGYEGYYEVSNFARVKSLHKKKAKNITPETDIHGYLRVILCKNGTKKNRMVHVLVAQAFIPNPENKKQVNHIDGNKRNNLVENLEWLTPSENIRHAFDMGLRKTGCEHHMAKFTAEQVRDIRANCVPDDPERGFKAFARKYGVTHRIISDAYYKRSYTNVE